MMTRREFLTRSTTILLLIPVAARCSSSSGTSTGMPSTSTPPPTGCDGVSTTSSVSESHVHTLCVPTTDLTSPPSGGMTYTTSTTSEHSHTVTLSAAELATIETGATVTIDSSNVVDPVNGAAHIHTFAIMKLVIADAGVADAPTTPSVDSGTTAPPNPTPGY